MCYSSKSSTGTWLLHFNSLLAKLTIYYSMCWRRSEKMNWLLIRVALRGHRGETTYSLAISVNGVPFLTRTAMAGPGHCLIIKTTESGGKSTIKHGHHLVESNNGQERLCSCVTAISSDNCSWECGQNGSDAWEVVWLHEVP